MEATSVTDIIHKFEEKEKQSKQRAIIMTFVPLIVGLLLITFTSQKVIKAQKELDKIEEKIQGSKKEVYRARDSLNMVKDSLRLLMDQNKSLRSLTYSLSQNLSESVSTLGKAVSVTSEFKKFIDKMEPYLRSQGEASFYINYRMLEDKISGNYNALSEKVSRLPKIDEKLNWIVIVESSRSLEDLKRQVNRLASLYGRNQVAIYRENNGMYVMSLKGNGTFTRAYRLNVELRDKYGYRGPYFSSSKDWGTNYMLVTR